MHLKIEKAALVKELALLSGVCEKKTTIPILSNILLATDGQVLRMSATDLDTGLTCAVPAEVTDGGAITLPGKRLHAYCAALPDGAISIATDDKCYATVKSGRSRSRMGGMAAEHFPEMPKVTGDAFTLPAADLASLFARVRFAISKEESRFTLNAALLEIESSGLVRCVATDGHRMSHVERAATGAERQPAKLMVSSSGIAAAQRLEGGDVSISQDDAHVFFAAGDRLLISRKMSGTFPDYKRVLPSYASPAVLNRGELSAALARVGQFADSRSRAVKLFMASGKGLEISAASADTGDSSETIGCVYGGDPIEIGLNCGYLSDFLAAAGSDTVRMFAKDGKSAVEFRPEGDGYRYVVMPMRI